MIRALQIYLAPLVAVVLTLWGTVIALAVEAYAPLPRMLADRGRRDHAVLQSLPRQLHLVRLTLLLVAGAMAATAVAWWSRAPAEGLPRFLSAIVLVWLVGDLLPRVLAANAPDLVASVQGVAGVSLKIFDPVLRLLAWIDRRTRIPLGVESAAGASQGREMLRGVFALREMTVAEIMTPRIDMVTVDLADPLEDVVTRFRMSGHSRLMVVEGNPDAVVGVVFAKDLIPRSDGSSIDDWKALVRQTRFVPEAKTLAAQLQEFQRGPSHLAVVVDEFGGTAGLVTLEDVLEQIVGEIQDEYDLEEMEPIVEVGPGQWQVRGGVALAELEGRLDYDFERDDVDTVGGLVLAVLGHVPRLGETAALSEFTLTVDQVIRRRVGLVTVTRATPAETDDEGAS
jgi:magnesium and cobalt transporter